MISERGIKTYMKKRTLEQILPLGTIVLLKGGNKKIMIIGRCQEDVKTKHQYDYSACFYPEGWISAQETIMFNQSEIDSVYYLGLQDGEEFAFRGFMEERLSELNLLEE